MSRAITIIKIGDTTVVKVVENNKVVQLDSCNSSRDLQVTAKGVTILADPNELMLNNFEINISELTNDGIDFSSVTTPEELLNVLATNKAFKKGGGLGSDEIQQLILNNTLSEADILNLIAQNTPSPAIDSDTKLIFGNVIWLYDLTFKVIAEQFKINGIENTETLTKVVTLNPSDLNNDRIDIFAVELINDEFVISVIKGTASEDPAKPVLDPETQLEISFANLAANATAPTGVSSEIIYKEGNEWTIEKISASIDPAYKINPISGLNSIICAEPPHNTVLSFKTDTPLFVNNSTLLTFDINLATEWEWKSSERITIDINLYSGNKGFTGRLRVGSDFGFNFDGSKINETQKVTIPIDRFPSYTSSNTFDKIQFKFKRTNNEIFKIDNIELVTGLTNSTISEKTKLSEFINDVPFLVNKDLIGLATENYVNDALSLIPIFPFPNLSNVVPDSYLPDNIGLFVLEGSYFIPDMCLQENINNIKGILFEGQTINYASYISSSKIICSVTTGSLDGTFSITLNNGRSKTFYNSLLIALGTVNKPTLSNYTSLSDQVDATVEGELTTLDTGTNYLTIPYIAKTNMKVLASEDFSLYFNLESPVQYPDKSIHYYPLCLVSIKSTVDDNVLMGLNPHITSYDEFIFYARNKVQLIRASANFPTGIIDNSLGNYKYRWGHTYMLRRVGSTKTLTIDGVIRKIYDEADTEDGYLNFDIGRYHLRNIKLVIHD